MTQTNSENQETFVNKENKGTEIIDEHSGDETNEKDDQLLLMTPKVILKRLYEQRQTYRLFLWLILHHLKHFTDLFHKWNLLR